jgi:hypothetical protein
MAFSSGKSIYEYEGVSETLYQAIYKADSIGGAFTRTIRADPKRFPYRKLTAEEMAFVEFVDKA